MYDEPKKSDKLSFYLSFAQSDLASAQYLVDNVAVNNRTVWERWNQRWPISSATWVDDFEAAIVKEENFVVLLSEHSCGNEQFVCNIERNFALKYGKRIIPIIIKGDENSNFRVPEDIAHIPPLEYPALTEYKALPASFTLALCSQLDAGRDHVENHTQLNIKAWKWDKKGRPNYLLLNPIESEKFAKYVKNAIAKKLQPGITALQQDFLDTSLRTHDCSLM